MQNLLRYSFATMLLILLGSYGWTRAGKGRVARICSGHAPSEPQVFAIDVESTRPIGSLQTETGGADSRNIAATHLMPIGAMLAASATGQSPAPRISAIVEDTARWEPPYTPPERLGTSTNVRIEVENYVGVRVFHNNNEITNPTTDQSTNRATFTIATLAAGPQDNRVNLFASGAASATETILIRTPVAQLSRPSFANYSNNPFINDSQTPADTNAPPIRVNGTFLRVAGRFDPTGFSTTPRFEFLLFNRGTRKFERQPVRAETLVDGGNWSATLTLPVLPGGTEWTLRAMLLDGDRYSYSTNDLRLAIAQTLAPTIRPQLASVSAGMSAIVVSPIHNARFTNQKTLNAVIQMATVPQEWRTDGRVVLYRDESGTLFPLVNGTAIYASTANNIDTWNVTSFELPGPGDYRIQARIVLGSLPGAVSEPILIRMRTNGPRIESIDPPNMLFGEGPVNITLRFDADHPLGNATDKTNYQFQLRGKTVEQPSTVEYESRTNSVTLRLGDLADGTYDLLIKKTLVDLHGNAIEGPAEGIKLTFVKSGIVGRPTVTRGLLSTTGEYVSYPEFTPPRKVPQGFNPADKVETRTVRLYYFRDAHRVAQIVNRKVRSRNAQGASVARQLADKARSEADSRTIARRDAEQTAIRAATRLREREDQIRQTEQQLNATLRDIQAARLQGLPATDERVTAMAAAVRSQSTHLDSLRSGLQHLRDEAATQNELQLKAEQKERLAYEEKFRREVAAEKEDPDTYGEGKPDSNDPVEQVTISVIGEGVIHLRGPLKGINTIRTMIDQIDSPVGQVRVSVHTVQINGEKADRMEVVADTIQKYIDHSRFLTMQSAEMLRKSVVHIAAIKAEESRALFPGDHQADRDKRYLYAFFGKDFIDELTAMDSEFLRSGNKVLSLHSMDVTSLSAALTVFALAKNRTRIEILNQFEQLMRTELPRAEHSYLEAGMSGPAKKKLQIRHQPKFYELAQNARFESLRGFFNSELQHDDTLTPIQREFLRLAQIFKSRLVTELEYKQRVMERALIEDRIRNSAEEFASAVKDERDAEIALKAARVRIAEQRGKVGLALGQVQSEIEAVVASCQRAATESDRLSSRLLGVQSIKDASKILVVDTHTYVALNATRSIVSDVYWNSLRLYRFRKHKAHFLALQEIACLKDTVLREYRKKRPERDGVPGAPPCPENEKDHDCEMTEEMKLEVYRAMLRQESLENIRAAPTLLREIAQGFQEDGSHLRQAAAEIQGLLSRPDVDMTEAYNKWIRLRTEIMDNFWDPQAPEHEHRRRLLDQADAAFERGLEARFDILAAREKAGIARRPLDHKKLLDMLIDEVEEKYIELLEGTRAHTANVDNYIKRLTTALDDDFNTQFYNPTFRFVRESSQFYDVQFGQTETTSILANNREFAKVEPNATMEFDLPARDILLSEGINSAKALYNDVGALANDPNFLALARMKTGQSPANPAPGSAGGFGVVRDVLPGLDHKTSEQIIAQNANGRHQFGSNMENLIPDPAIYKFETGTGYQIRPVIQPDGQAVVFDFNYMYSTNIREPVRADEKHLGRIKRHFIDTDVQLSNYELREVSRYVVALKASRTARGVPLLEDMPGVGVLFRPLPQDESSLQQNVILAQATIFPTLFDLMGLRWAPAVADLDPMRLANEEFLVRGRQRFLRNQVFDYASQQVDEFMRIPEGARRPDLYRSQESIPRLHPNGYQGPGLGLQDSHLQEGYQPQKVQPTPQFVPSQNPEGANPLRRPDADEGVEIIVPQNSPSPIIDSKPIQPPHGTAPRGTAPLPPPAAPAPSTHHGAADSAPTEFGAPPASPVRRFGLPFVRPAPHHGASRPAPRPVQRAGWFPFGGNKGGVATTGGVSGKDAGSKEVAR